MDRWCIIRTAGSATLALAETLSDVGYDVWTPVETIDRRARRTEKREQVKAAMLPSFLFAKSDKLAALVALSRSPSLQYRVWDSEERRMVTKGHPAFTVYSRNGQHPLVNDWELDALRTIERRRRPKGKATPFKDGARVKLTEGGFAGLYGTVQSMRGGFATVVIGDWKIPVQIAADLLTALDESPPVHVWEEGSEQALSAKAA